MEIGTVSAHRQTFPTIIIETESNNRKLSTDYSFETANNQSLTLKERLEIEKTTFHWYPYKRILYQELIDGTTEEECWDRPRAIDEFPQGWWDRKG